MNHIVAVQMSPGGTKHEHISRVISVTDGFKGVNLGVSDVIAHLKKYPDSVEVSDGTTTARVEVVDARPPYIRSVKDGKASDNLLSIARF